MAAKIKRLNKPSLLKNPACRTDTLRRSLAEFMPRRCPVNPRFEGVESVLQLD